MKLINITSTQVTPRFKSVLREGKKADWIALNQGDNLIKKGKEYNDHSVEGMSAQDIGNYLEKEGGKFAPYLAQLYLRGDVTKLEDMYRVKQLINQFNENRQHIEIKDITRYSLAQLQDVVKQFTKKLSTKHVNPVIDEEMEKGGHMTKLISTPNFEVVVGHTKTGSTYLGKGTKVCTAADDEHNQHEHYNNQGMLYTVRAGNRRFLLHYESDQFKDENDEELSKKDIAYLSEFKMYSKFLEMMIKKHYFNAKIIDNALSTRRKKIEAKQHI